MCGSSETRFDAADNAGRSAVDAVCTFLDIGAHTLQSTFQAMAHLTNHLFRPVLVECSVAVNVQFFDPLVIVLELLLLVRNRLG